MVIEMAKIKSLKIDYYDQEGCAYKEFAEDEDVEILAITRKVETTRWKSA